MAARRGRPRAADSIVAVANIVPRGQMVGKISDVTHTVLVREMLMDRMLAIPWRPRYG